MPANALPEEITGEETTLSYWEDQYDLIPFETYEEATARIRGYVDDAYEIISYPSTPATLINIPEVKAVTGKFVYNFYLKDERTSGNQNGILTVPAGSQESLQIERLDDIPRYNTISIQPSKFNSEDETLRGMVSDLGDNIIENHLDKLYFEGSLASGYFSGIHLEDDGVDQSFYYALSSSVSFFGIDSLASGNKISEEISSIIGATSIFSSNGSQIRDALSNIQTQNASYASTDVREEVSEDAFRSVRFIDYDLTVNSKFVKNVLLGSIEDKTNIFQDEIERLLSRAASAQRTAIAQYVPGTIAADEYELTLRTLSEIRVDATSENTSKYNEASLPIGFYIEKTEIVMNPDGTWYTVSHNPIIFENYNLTNFIDTDVKYGSTYIYNVRTVALTMFEAILIDSQDELEDQVIVAVVMVASDGTRLKIDCNESIPPNPPGDITFRWDYATNNLVIYWEEALNPQRDIVRYQIFRRKTIDVPFTLIGEIDFDQSTSKVIPTEVAPEDKIIRSAGHVRMFKDLDFTMDSKYIYAICTADAHGLSSNYSAQFEISFVRSKNSLSRKLISRSNAPKIYPNIYLNQDLFVDTMKDSNHTRLRVFFDPEYYDVYQKSFVNNYSSGKPLLKSKTESLKLIGNKYKLQIINVDSQQSNLISISIDDQSESLSSSSAKRESR